MIEAIATIASAATEKIAEVTINGACESSAEAKSVFPDSNRPKDCSFEQPCIKDMEKKLECRTFSDSQRPVENTGLEMPKLKSDVDDNRIPCRNEELAGKKHPITGVPFEKKTVIVEGKEKEVVVPVFESVFDAKLPDDKLQSSDAVQFKECNAQLKEAISQNSELKSKFSDEQLERIENGDTPEGYTWHHDAESGVMKLVDTDKHQQTGHTGGRNIWGGGSENR